MGPSGPLGPLEERLHPLEVDYGTIAAFHGALCRHRAPPNASPYLRASLDFRVGVGRFFDPDWRLPGVKAQHGWRRWTTGAGVGAGAAASPAGS